MHVGAGEGLLVRLHETPVGGLAQPGRLGVDHNTKLAVPDQDITALWLDDRSRAGS